MLPPRHHNSLRTTVTHHPDSVRRHDHPDLVARHHTSGHRLLRLRYTPIDLAVSDILIVFTVTMHQHHNSVRRPDPTPRPTATPSPNGVRRHDQTPTSDTPPRSLGLLLQYTTLLELVAADDHSLVSLKDQKTRLP